MSPSGAASGPSRTSKTVPAPCHCHTSPSTRLQTSGALDWRPQRHEQNAAVPLDRVPEKRLAGCDCGCQIDCCEGLCGAPLTRQQPVPNSRQYMLHEPRCSRAGIGAPVFVERRQILRLVLIELLIVELIIGITEWIILVIELGII